MTEPEAQNDQQGKRRFRALRWVGYVVAALLALVLLFVLFLQTPPGKKWVRSTLISQVNKALPEARIEVGEVDGSVIWDLALYDVDLFSTVTGDTLVHADTLRTDYDLFGLFGGTLELSETLVSGLRVDMEQTEAGTWDLVDAVTADSAAADTAQQALTVLLDDARIRNGRLRMDFAAGPRDSLLTGSDLYLTLESARFGESATVVLDTLHGRISPPGQTSGPLQLAAAGRLSDEILALETLRIRSPRSDLAAEGRIPLDFADPGAEPTLDLRAEPLAFRDLAWLLPSLNPEATVQGTIRARGSGDRTALEADLESGSGGRVTAEGALRLFTEGRVGVEMEASLTDLDPGYLLIGDQPTGPLNAELTTDLDGPTWGELSGTLTGSLSGARWQSYEIRRANVEAQLEEGTIALAADAALRGGSLSASGTIDPSRPALDLRGSFSNVRLAQLLEDSELETDLTGSYSVTADGFDLATAEWDAAVEIRDGTISGQQIRYGTADLQLLDGELDAEVDLQGPFGSLYTVAAGNITDDASQFAIREGRFTDLDVGALTGGTATSSLTGTFSGVVRGVGTDETTLSADLVVSGSYQTFDIESLDVAAEGSLARLRADLQGTVDGATIDATASLPLQTPAPWSAEGDFANLDLGALTDDPSRTSDLTGSFTADGRLLASGGFTADVALDLSEGSLDGRRIEQGYLTASIRGDRVDFDVDLESAGGDLAARGTAQIGEATQVTIDEGSFDRLDLSFFTGDTSLTTSLQGTLAGDLSFTSLEDLDANIDLQLTDSRVNQFEIQSGQATLTAEAGRAQLDATVQTPDGGLDLLLTADELGAAPSIQIQEGRFRSLDVAAFLPAANWSTSLTGRLEADGTLTTEDDRPFTFRIELDSSRVNEAVILDGLVTGRRGEGALTADAALDFVTGSLTARGRTTLGERPAYQFSAAIDSLALSDLFGARQPERATLTAAITADGEGVDPQTMRLDASIEGGEGTYGDEEVEELTAQLQIRDARLRVDSMRIRSTLADLTGTASLPLDTQDFAAGVDLALQGTVEELGPLERLPGFPATALDAAEIDVQATGSLAELRLQGVLEADNLVYDQIRMADVDTRFDLRLDSLRRPERGMLDLSLGFLATPVVAVEDLDIDARFDGQLIDAQGNFLATSGRETTFQTLVNPMLDEQQVIIRELQFELGGENWELLTTAQFEYGEAYRISNLLLYSDTQQIAIDGIIDPNGRQSLVLTVEQLQMGPVAEILGFGELGGTLSGSVDLTGPAVAPRLDGLLSVALRFQDELIGDGRLEIDYGNQTLALQTRLENPDGSALRAEGVLPIDLRLATDTSRAGGAGVTIASEGPRRAEELEFDIQADSFSVSWVRPFLDPDTIRDLEGRLSGGVQIRGSLSDPDVNGNVRLSDGRLRLPQQNIDVNRIRARAELDGTTIRLVDARARSGGGTITGEGTIELDQLTLGRFDLYGDLDDFLATDTREQRAIVSGDVHLTGTTRRPALEGDVDVVSADVYLTENVQVENVGLSEKDIRAVERNFGIEVSEADTSAFEFYTALSMNMDVRLEQDVWLRSESNPELNILLTGNLDLQKAHYEELNVFGTIEISGRRSYINQFGRRFDITDGTLRFNGPAGNPLVDIQAQFETRTSGAGGTQSDINLLLTGRLDDLEVSFTGGDGEPLEGTELVSTLAFSGGSGGTGGLTQLLSGDDVGGVLTGQGQALAFSQAATLIENVASREIGLDVVEITRENEFLYLTVGTYLRVGALPNPIFVSVRQPVSLSNTFERQGSTDFIIEYELLEWLLMRVASRGQESELRYDLFWEYSY